MYVYCTPWTVFMNICFQNSRYGVRAHCYDHPEANEGKVNIYIKHQHHEIIFTLTC